MVAGKLVGMDENVYSPFSVGRDFEKYPNIAFDIEAQDWCMYTSDAGEINDRPRISAADFLAGDKKMSEVEQIRQAFADYIISEGCSCCRDTKVHEKAEKRLAKLLKPDAYEDGSGWDWSKYSTKTNPEP